MLNSISGRRFRAYACAIWIIAAAGAAFGQTVTSLALTSTASPSVYGRPVTLTATLTGGGTGNVTFFDGVTPLGVGTVSGAEVVFTTSLLGTGSHALRAVYIGDSTHFASTSAAVTQTVNSVAATGLLVGSLYSNVSTEWIITGDFNGDGKTDLAFAAYESQTIGVLPGNGDGTFGPPIYSNAALSGMIDSFPLALVTGDFNGDGKSDLAFAVVFGPSSPVFGGGPQSNYLCVMLGNGDGTFQPAVELYETSPNPDAVNVYGSAITVGDFNGDGRLDIFHPPFMFLGNGDGTFQSPMNLTISGPLSAIAAGDFNGDGQTDVATISSFFASGVYVQQGTGSGTFQPAAYYAVPGGGATFILTGDFNGDGKPDLAVAQLVGAAGAVSILLGNGNGTFQAAITSAAGVASWCCIPPLVTLAAADFNGDGKLDLAVSVEDHIDGLSLLLGNGDGTFQPPVNYEGSYTPYSFATGDFNGDGRVDLAADFGDVGIYLGASAGLPLLAITEMEGGTFRQGMPGNYLITITNTGTGQTSSSNPTVVTDTLPTGLTAASIEGTGWTCTLSLLQCTRNDLLTPGVSYPAINLSVNVAPNAASPQVNMVTVTGGGSPTASVTDSATIVANLAALQITNTHIGNFTQGQSGAIYTITVSNGAGAKGPSSGTVTVTESLAESLTLVTMYGSGWTCPGDGTCARNDVLAAGAAYPAISVVVNVAANAISPVTNQAAVSGGFSLTANASDMTTILRGQGISFGPLSNVPVGTSPFSLSATASSGLIVAFASSTPAVCSVSGSTVTILSSGGCSITATQPGNSTYGPATPVTQSFTVFFFDVSSADSDYSAINAMAQLGITAGCGSNGFCPDLNVTRDEMAIFVVRAIYGNDNFTYTTTPYFTDVTPTTFGFKWIQKLKDLGITNGCTATTYCPLDVVARDQMAVFIIRARLGVAIAGPNPTFTYPTTPYFTDATAAGEFAFPWIQRMKLDGITNGCMASAYCGTDAVTRGAMAIFIMRGAFNQFLPAGTPVISSISPSALPVGSTETFTITGANTNFVQGTTQVSPIPGITIGTITVTSATSMTVQLTAASTAVSQPYSILAITGSEQDVLPNGLVIQ